MKRDMDLIRELLLKLESLNIRPGAIVLIGGHDEELAIEGRAADEIDYHLALIKEAHLIECPGSGSMDGRISFRRLTWSGHDFLDSVRDPKIWEKTKSSAEAAGGFTIDLLKDIAKGFVRKQIEEYTGVKL